MIVPKLSLPLSSHTTLGLHQLFSFVRPALMTLTGVEVLKVGARVGVHRFAVANRVAVLRDATHAGPCSFTVSKTRGSKGVHHTVVRVRSRTAHHWHRLPPAKWKLAAFA